MSTRGRHTLACFAIVTSIGLASVPVAAQESAGAMGEADAERDARARRLFQQGRAAVLEERWLDAAVYFEDAYALSPRPELLFNAGAARQRAGHAARALAHFRRLVEVSPDLDDIEDVRARIRALTEASAEASAPEDLLIGGVSTLGVGGVAAVACVVSWAFAGEARARVEGASGVAWETVRSDAELADTLGTVGGVMLALSLSAIAIGAVLLVLREGSAPADAAAGLRWGPGGVGLAF